MQRIFFYGLLAISFVSTLSLLFTGQGFIFLIGLFSLAAASTRFFRIKNIILRLLLTLAGLAATGFLFYILISLAEFLPNNPFVTVSVSPVITNWIWILAISTFAVGLLGLWWIVLSKNKPLGKVAISIIAAIAVVIAAGAWAFVEKPWIRLHKPEGNTAKSFLLNEVGYECSQPIEGEWVEAWVGNPGGRGYNFRPKSQEDFDKFCRSTYAIEYRAVLDILRREDVRSVIAKYNTSQAWVRALGHKYISDKDYLKRILPKYADVKIDCIIVVHSPEGTRFFIENGEVHRSHADHRYIELPAEEFLASLNAAPAEDANNFWLALH